jgi:hypothetical protein
VDDLLHREAEERSLELHRAVAGRLVDQPQLLEEARTRVDRWLRDGSVAPAWAEVWREILSRPPDVVAALLRDTGQRARDLRQCSPFAGALRPLERWQILRGLRKART